MSFGNMRKHVEIQASNIGNRKDERILSIIKEIRSI